MGMQFTVTAAGTLTVTGIDASYDTSELDAETLIRDNVPYYGTAGLSFEDVEVTEATVTVEARVSLTGIEVEAREMADFDADTALEEALLYVGNVSDATFDIEDSPTGFVVVADAIGQEQALEAYAALSAAGYEVS